MPVIGKLNVAAITTDDVLKMVEPLWGSKHETATGFVAELKVFWIGQRFVVFREGENPAR